jgi:glycosyltransferase involved in cell wall biosynthesis
MLFDVRWTGKHGIGRFAHELAARLPATAYAPTRRHLGPLEPWRLGADLRRRRPDLFVSPGFAAIVGYSAPFVVTVHDLIHLETAERSLAKVGYYEGLLKPTLKRAAAVLTVSEFSRERICDWAGLTPERVHVVGNGVSAAFVADGPRMPSPRPYLLYVGNDKPHKNLGLLLSGFESGRLHERYDLVLVAPRSPYADRPWLHWRSGLSEAELASCYRGAQALVMPSRYEGFGLPVVEAMACGIPVLASDAPAIREVAGDAAALFGRDDVDGLLAAVEGLDDEADRSRRVRRGLDRAACFSWERVAARTLAVLEDVLGGGGTVPCA